MIIQSLIITVQVVGVVAFLSFVIGYGLEAGQALHQRRKAKETNENDK